MLISRRFMKAVNLPLTDLPRVGTSKSISRAEREDLCVVGDEGREFRVKIYIADMALTAYRRWLHVSDYNSMDMYNEWITQTGLNVVFYKCGGLTLPYSLQRTLLYL